jgi:hypothetical protein
MNEKPNGNRLWMPTKLTRQTEEIGYVKYIRDYGAPMEGKNTLVARFYKCQNESTFIATF